MTQSTRELPRFWLDPSRWSRGIAVLAALLLLGASAHPEEQQNPPAKPDLTADWSRSKSIPGEVIRVEPVIADPRFEGIKVNPPSLILAAKLSPQAQADKKSVARVVLDGPQAGALFNSEVPFDYDDAKHQFVIKPVARTHEFKVAYLDGDGRVVAGPGRPVTLKYYDSNACWKDIPAYAYRWETEAGGTSRIVVLPAAFDQSYSQPHILVGAPGYEAEFKSLVPRTGQDAASSQDFRLSPLVKIAPLPDDLASRYPRLKNSGVCINNFVETLSPGESRWIWRWRTEPKRAKGGFCIFPGFRPVPVYVDERQQARTYTNDRQDHPLPFGEWRKASLIPTSLVFQVGQVEDIPFRTDEIPVMKLKDLSPQLAVYLDDDLLFQRSLVFSNGGNRSAEFDLPKLYDIAANWAIKKGLEAVDGFEALETRSSFRLLPAQVKGMMPYVLKIERPFDQGFDPDLWSRWVFRESTPTNPTSLKSGLLGVEVSVKVARPEQAPAGFEKNIRFFDGAGSGKSIPDKLYRWEDNGGSVRFYLPYLMVAGYSNKIRAEYPESGPVEFDLMTSKPLVEARHKGTLDIKFGPSGLRVMLPSGLKPDPAAILRITSADATRRQVRIELDPLQPDRMLSAKELVIDPTGSLVELYIPDFKPLIIRSFSGRVIDAKRQESTVGTKFVVVVNNWSDIVTPNEVVQSDINSLQKLVCEKLMSQSVEDKQTRAAGYALVSPAEANWPKGDSSARYLSTGTNPPLPRMSRRDDNRPDEIWRHLRDLLSHPDVAGEHGVVQLVLVTPLHLTLASKEDDPDKLWLKERIESGRVQLKTIVIGGPEVRNLNAERLAKAYYNPLVLKVGPNGVDYNGDGKDAGLDLLPEWLKTKILK